MEMNLSPKLILSTTTLAFASVLPSFAQVAADDDNASRAIYDNGITNFENGSTTGNGSGFGAWVFNNAAGNFDIASSSSNGGSGSIDVSGDSFRLLDVGDAGGFIGATRFFDGGDFGIGQSLSFDLDVNFLDGFKGVNIKGENTTTTIFNFEGSTNVDGVGTDGYIVGTAATGGGALFGNAYNADSVFSLIFTQTGLTSGDWFITRSGGLAGTASGTYSGRITAVEFFTLNAGSGVERALLFNNLQITVPEPGTFALLSGLAALGYVMLRRRD